MILSWTNQISNFTQGIPLDIYDFTLQVIGAHVEGPFINIDKKGAHNPEYVQHGAPQGVDTLVETYGSLENVSIVTVAPELPGILDLIPHLVEKNVVVSIGHTAANFALAEDAVSIVGGGLSFWNKFFPFFLF